MKPGNRPSGHAHESCILSGAWEVYSVWQAVFSRDDLFRGEIQFFPLKIHEPQRQYCAFDDARKGDAPPNPV